MSVRGLDEATLHVTYLTGYIWHARFSIAKPSGKYDMINLEDALLVITTDDSNRPPLALGAGFYGNYSNRSPDI